MIPMRTVINSIRNRLSVLRGLFGFLVEYKLWWMIPMIVVLMLFFVIIILGHTTPLGPFIYTLF